MPTNYFTSPQVQARFGISEMSLWRWQQDPKLDFPKPMIVNGRKYFAEDELVEWERRQVRRSTHDRA